MIEDKKNIDKLFHDVLYNNEHDVPNYVWDNIKDDLIYKKKQKNRIFFRNIAASIIMILTFTCGYFFTDLFPIEKGKSSKAEINKENLEVKEKKNNINLEKKSLNIDNKVIKDFDTQQQKNLAFQNKGQNNVLLSNTDEKSPKINKKGKGNKPVNQKKLLANRNKNDVKKNNSKSFTKSAGSDKIIYEKLQLLNADKIETQSKSDRDLVYSFNEVPVLNIEIEKKKKSHWSVEGQFSPVYAFRDVKKIDAVYEASANSNNYYNEEPIAAFSVGANMKYQVSNRLKFQTGIYYSETGQVTKDAVISSAPMYGKPSDKYLFNTTVGNVIQTASPNPNPVSIIIDRQSPDNLLNDKPIHSDIVQNFNYVEIPAIVKYKIIDQKIDINILGGINTNFLVGNNVTVKTEAGNHDAGETKDINSIIYSGMFGVNFEYPLFKNFSFSLEPTFKYSLTSINKFNSVYPYSFAVFSGINFTFQ